MDPSPATNPTYGFGATLPLPFEAALAAVVAALKEEGFGVLTTIDVQATLTARLGVETPPYAILGACNPPLAHRALTLDPAVGLLLPCNVVVRATGDRSEVLIADPEAMMQITANPALADVAHEAKAKLAQVITRLTAHGGDR